MAECQTITIATEEIDKLWLRELFCIDSSGNKSRLCQLCFPAFQVKFQKATYEESSKQLHLLGRLSPSMPEVGIYVSTASSITNKSPIAYTSYDEKDVHKNGYFDISVSLEPELKLFFYHRSFFARQYDLYKLLNHLVKSNKHSR